MEYQYLIQPIILTTKIAKVLKRLPQAQQRIVQKKKI